MNSAFASAVGWFMSALAGTVASLLAVIAVAALGFAMLSGRIDTGRAGRLLLGCALVFGAPVIGGALVRISSAQPTPPAQAVAPAPIKLPDRSSGYDPYAGASVPQNR